MPRTKMQETIIHLHVSSMTQVLFLCQLGLTADGNIYTQWISSYYEI